MLKLHPVGALTTLSRIHHLPCWGSCMIIPADVFNDKHDDLIHFELRATGLSRVSRLIHCSACMQACQRLTRYSASQGKNIASLGRGGRRADGVESDQVYRARAQFSALARSPWDILVAVLAISSNIDARSLLVNVCIPRSWSRMSSIAWRASTGLYGILCVDPIISIRSLMLVIVSSPLGSLLMLVFMWHAGPCKHNRIIPR